MNNELFYNVGKQNITNGLKNLEISSGQDYFILLDAPDDANITIRINNEFAPEIPIKVGYQVKSTNVSKIFLSCDSVLNGVITYGQADGNLVILPNPNVKNIESISKINDKFAPKAVMSQTINAGAYFDLDISNLEQIRFISNDFVNVDLFSNGIKYEMLEDIIILRNLAVNSIRFHNDTASAVNVVFWSM